ncbi:MAG: TonB-dependent receptor [Magnetococcus sp. DMHC-1]
MIFFSRGSCAQWLVLPFLLVPTAGKAADRTHLDSHKQMEALLEVGFEELANIRLTTAARKEQRLVDTPSAVYVITQEEIRRSGMNSLPELLRLVPGMNVARINGNNWAISARGFNEQFSNKLLVLQDGRTLYTPLFAGVNWDVQDTLLEDVERIEVIRGPGGTLWGANAVNGIVNIITKQAADTTGWLVTGGSGNQEKVQAGLRFGGAVGDKANFRFYAKGFDQDDLKTRQGTPAGDGWHAGQGGFRLDWQPGGKDRLTLQGDLYNVQEEMNNTHNGGGNLLLHWSRTLDQNSRVDLQVYHDRTVRMDFEERDISDIDIQHRFRLPTNQEIVWGMGYRLSADTMQNNPVVGWNHLATNDETYNLFLQDEISLLNKRLALTIGSKFEHNDYTGWELQPNARVLWQVADDHVLWAAVSRAIRSPSRADTDLTLNIITGPASRILVNGNPGIQSEELLAYEVGYRTLFISKVYLDLALFYNQYDKLITNEKSVAMAGGFLTINQSFANKGSGSTHGIETSVEWRAADTWKLRASHAWLHVNLNLNNGSTDTTLAGKEGNVPGQQLQIRSAWSMTPAIEFDTALFHVSRLAALDIPAYVRADARLGWQPQKNLQISLVAQNLLDDQHPEFTGTSVSNSEIARTFFLKAAWNY